MMKGNFFDLYFGNSDSDCRFKGFDQKSSSIMMLSLVTICAMMFNCMWTKVDLNKINGKYD